MYSRQFHKITKIDLVIGSLVIFISGILLGGLCVVILHNSSKLPYSLKVKPQKEGIK